MNSKLIIIGLMLSSLFAISACGRQKTLQLVNLQDDESGDHLVFAIATGEYKTVKMAIIKTVQEAILKNGWEAGIRTPISRSRVRTRPLSPRLSEFNSVLFPLIPLRLP